MADNMMRISGRGIDGTAKAIKTDNEGNLMTKQTSGIVANDGIGNLVELTAVQRIDGTWVLLTAEATTSPASPVTIVSGTTDLQAVVATLGLQLMGIALSESASPSAYAQVRLHHGTQNTAPELFDITLNPGESIREWFPEGIAVDNGIYLDRVSGSTKLNLFTRTVV